MSTTHGERRISGGSVVVGFATLVVIATALITRPWIRAMVFGPSSPTILEIVDAFERGAVSPGDPIDGLLRAGFKPEVYALSIDDADDIFGVAIASHRGNMLVVYTLNGAIYAAHHLEYSGSHTERWFFCEEDTLRRHIAHSRRVAPPRP